MFDYGQDEKYRYRICTRLDDDMHIGRVKINWIFTCLAFLIIALLLSGSVPFALGTFGFCIILCRKFFRDEERGLPTTHRSIAIRILGKLPSVIKEGILPSMTGIEDFRKSYRR